MHLTQCAVWLQAAWDYIHAALYICVARGQNTRISLKSGTRVVIPLYTGAPCGTKRSLSRICAFLFVDSRHIMHA